MKKSFQFHFAIIFVLNFNLQAQTQLWGTTQLGQTGVYGTIYTISNGDSISYAHEFANALEGWGPYGRISLANNGFIYGATTQGGLNNKGVIYKINPNTHAYTKIFDFNTSTGYWCTSGLMKGSDGNLYGTNDWGGANGAGVIFKVDPSTDTYSVLYNLDTVIGRVASLWEMINNKIYGVTAYWGANELGTMFSFDLGTNSYTVLHVNDSLTGYGMGSLLHIGGGVIIGTAAGYDTLNSFYGVLYKYDINTNIRTILHNFDTSTGFSVVWNMILANDGKIYGTTSAGGTGYTSSNIGEGVIFSFDLNTSTYTALYNFDNAITGGQSQCGIMQASNGLLYTATFGWSRVINFDTNSNSMSIVSDFPGLTSGPNASTPLIEVSNITAINNNNSMSTIAVMPNPAQDYIMINNSDKASKVTCLDILGREIVQIQLIGFGKTKVDVSGYPNVFFVKDNYGEVIKVMRNN